MKQINSDLLAFFMSAIIISFGFSNSFSQVTDIDGKVYKTVTIGNQEWMVENLNVEHYRNGDVIPQIQDADRWTILTTGAWCYYENNPENGRKYGKLYNWYSVNDARGLAPEGWHVPSDAEWTQLTDFLGGEKVAGDKLKATTFRTSINTVATNSSGFTAIPSGSAESTGYFYNIGEGVLFWATSEFNFVNAWYRGLWFSYSNVYLNYGNKNSGMSVRCVRDK